MATACFRYWNPLIGVYRRVFLYICSNPGFSTSPNNSCLTHASYVTVVRPAGVPIRVLLTEEGHTYRHPFARGRMQLQNLRSYAIFLGVIPSEIFVRIPIGNIYCQAIRELIVHEYEVPILSSFCERTWIYYLLHIFHSKITTSKEHFDSLVAKTIVKGGRRFVPRMTYPGTCSS